MKDLRVFKINKAIDKNLNKIFWSKPTHTAQLKCCAFESIRELLFEDPVNMCNYLLNNSRTGGFQNRLFKKYITILESKLPFIIIKNNEEYVISDILNKSLNIFNGQSVFTGMADRGSVKNRTEEIYIGGRSSAYIKPYYIGKLLNVTDIYGKSLMNNVISYSFQSIKVSNIVSGTEVIVTHNRVVPHYQMGAMLYINRARKSIINSVRI